MKRRPIHRKVHLVHPFEPDGNLSSLVNVHVAFDGAGQETFLCQECKSDRCVHCEKVFDDLCAEKVLSA